MLSGLINRFRIASFNKIEFDAASAWRLFNASFFLVLFYGLSMLQSVRYWYSDVDKFAHALAFSVVYIALAWALRWRPWSICLLALLLGAGVELHQYFLPRFKASFNDWVADAVGIAIACCTHFFWRRRDRAPPQAMDSGVLLPEQFQQAVAALPLVSVDWVLCNAAGELLVGQRINAPARGAWFTPGGRIRKGEPLTVALQRVAAQELGLSGEHAALLVQRGQLMGAWDHFYADSAFSPSVPTHYVNLPYWAALSAEEVQALRLPVGDQHGNWRWLPLSEAAGLVHANVQPYVAWLQARHT